MRDVLVSTPAYQSARSPAVEVLGVKVRIRPRSLACRKDAERCGLDRRPRPRSRVQRLRRPCASGSCDHTKSKSSSRVWQGRPALGSRTAKAPCASSMTGCCRRGTLLSGHMSRRCHRDRAGLRGRLDAGRVAPDAQTLARPCSGWAKEMPTRESYPTRMTPSESAHIGPGPWDRQQLKWGWSAPG